MSRPTSIQIDLKALVHNCQQVSQYAPKSKLICCVKANAYGHGIEGVADVLAPISDALAVASIEEAMVLRDRGIRSPILLLEGFYEAEELALIKEQNLWTALHNHEQLIALEKFTEVKNFDEAKATDTAIDVWVKIDTGMHRLGFQPEEVSQIYQRLRALDLVNNIRLMTHFACADEPENGFTRKQIDCFDALAADFSVEKSLANSAGIIHWPRSHADWVRPGFMLYGLSPFGPDYSLAHSLQPVMTFRTQVIAIKRVAAGEGIGYNHNWRAERETNIAVLAAGYGDGYPRNTKNGAPVLIEGQISRTVGRVAMDMMMVDVTGITGVQVGSEAELWGKNLSVNEVAAHSDYSPYELLTRIPARPSRDYI